MRNRTTPSPVVKPKQPRRTTMIIIDDQTEDRTIQQVARDLADHFDEIAFKHHGTYMPEGDEWP